MRIVLLSTLILVVFAESALFASIGSDDAMEISKQGLLVQKYRLNLIAKNVANAFTLMTEDGTPYSKKYAVIRNDGNGVRVLGEAESDQPYGKVYDPANPFADRYGFVYLPNVNIAEEMVDLTYTNVLYEANTTTFKSAKTMYQQALDILK
jgi:flagellar basal-body rod protein FlgC